MCYIVGKQIVEKHGKHLTKEIAKLGLGKRPEESWQAIIDALDLEISAKQFVEETEPLLRARCCPLTHELNPQPPVATKKSHLLYT